MTVRVHLYLPSIKNFLYAVARLQLLMREAGGGRPGVATRVGGGCVACIILMTPYFSITIVVTQYRLRHRVRSV